MYVYVHLFPDPICTVGRHLADGSWEPESTYELPEDAAARVHQLNLGNASAGPYEYGDDGGVGIWTVGFIAPDGIWIAESDHNTESAAIARTHYLNGRPSIRLDS